jgi:hypothetical protein
MNEQTPDQADTRMLVLDQLRLIGDLLTCLDAAGYDSEDTERLQFRLATHLRQQADSPVPRPGADGHALHQELDEALFDSLDVAALIARSSLGAPTARRIRYQTSADQIAEILSRRDQEATTGLLMGRLAGTQRKILGRIQSWLSASVPDKARMLRTALSPVRTAAVVSAVITAAATLAFIATGQQRSPSPTPVMIAMWPTPLPQPTPSFTPPPARPRITGTYTYRQGKMVYFGIRFSDPGHIAEGLGFIGIDGSRGPRQIYPFSSPSPAVIETNSVSYPLDQGCGTDAEHTSTIKAWIYGSMGIHSQSVIIHLSCAPDRTTAP